MNGLNLNDCIRDLVAPKPHCEAIRAKKESVKINHNQGSASAKESRGSQTKPLQVPQRLLKLLADLREYLQQSAALPVLLSDRRLAKATRLLQIAAFTCGGVEVSELDLLLLQHVFWDRNPEQGEQVRQWLLENCSSHAEEAALAVAQKRLNRIRDKLSGPGRFPGVRRATWHFPSPSRIGEACQKVAVAKLACQMTMLALQGCSGRPL